MQITQKGQVTIPQNIRDRFGFLAHTEVEFIIEGNNVIIRKKQDGSPFRKLRGIVKGKFTTDEIMALTRK